LSFELVLIVACAKSRVIGVNNSLPWHLPEDLAHFKRLTTGHCIIMGRKTYESIGRPLPNRRSIVVTRHPEISALQTVQGIELAGSLDEALQLSQTTPGQTTSSRGTPVPASSKAGFSDATKPLVVMSPVLMSPVFIIGGAQLYSQALDRADRIELTEIDLEIEGDVFFPEIRDNTWRISSESRRAETLLSRSGLRYRFLTYQKKVLAPTQALSA
jgi:dihydrofolate reductase